MVLNKVGAKGIETVGWKESGLVEQMGFSRVVMLAGK